jgi:predicted nucleic acid-binding OB-fold protein
MSLATQTTEELQARKMRALKLLAKLEQRLKNEREIVDWLVEEIDKELRDRTSI